MKKFPGYGKTQETPDRVQFLAVQNLYKRDNKCLIVSRFCQLNLTKAVYGAEEFTQNLTKFDCLSCLFLHRLKE